MFSKTLLLSTAMCGTEAIRLHSGAHSKTRAGVYNKLRDVNTCGNNIKRWSSTHETEDFIKYSNHEELYEDPDFGAEESSLFLRDHLYDGEMIGTYTENVTGWARPSEMTEGKPSLWGSKGVLPAGTNQGLLGDCWMLASASALAEHPDRVMKMFTNTEYDSAGIF